MPFTEDPLINWQKDYKNWPDRMAFIMEKENLSDFKFIVGPKKTVFHAHKLIFAISSPEFENLFYLLGSDMKEILLPDVTPEIFNQFLDFVYNGRVEITLENIGELLKLSKRYVITLLIDKCQDFLEKPVEKDNVLRILEIADELPALESKCLKLIADNCIELFQCEEFVKIRKSSLNKIVENEMLPCKEIVLFEAVNKWSEFACVSNELKVSSENKRQLLGDLVEKIRFGTMSLEEFGKCSVGNTILTPSEIVEIFKSLASATFSNQLFFKKRLIHAKVDELPLQTCLRFDKEPIPIKFQSLALNCSFNLTVDKHVYLCGIGIYGTCPKAFRIKKTSIVDISVFHDVHNIVSENSKEISFDGTNRIFDIFFKSPVLLEPFKCYVVFCNKTGPTNVFQNFTGMDGKTEIQESGVIFKITKGRFNNHDTAKRSIIAALYFKN